MSLILDLPRPVEVRLEQEAAKAGVPIAEYAALLLLQTLPIQRIDAEQQRQANASSLELLRSRLAQAQIPATLEALAESEAELTTFMQDMNKPRQEAGERLPYPDVQAKQDAS